MPHKIYFTEGYYITIDDAGYLTDDITCLEGAMGYVLQVKGQPPLAWKIPRLVGDSLRENAYVVQLLDTESENVRSMAHKNCDALLTCQLIARNVFDIDIFGITPKNAPPTRADSPRQRLLVSFEKGRRIRFATVEFARRDDTATRPPLAASPSEGHDHIFRPTGVVPERVATGLTRERLKIGPLFHSAVRSSEDERPTSGWDLLARGSETERAPVGWYVGLPSILLQWAQGTLQEVISRGDVEAWTLKSRYELMKRLLDGVLALHSNGLIHADLRPANIMFMTRREAPGDYKIADYGSLATGKPDMLGGAAGTADGGGRTVLQALHNARVSAFYAPERRNGFEHEEADTALVIKAEDKKRWIVLLGWRSMFEELRRAEQVDAGRLAASPPKATINDLIKRARAAFAEPSDPTWRRPNDLSGTFDPHWGGDAGEDHVGRLLLQRHDRIRLRERVFQVERIASTHLVRQCTVLLCESTMWKVFNERLIVQDDDFSRDFDEQLVRGQEYVEFSLPKVVELYQWSQATDIYSIGALLLYLCFPRIGMGPNPAIEGRSAERSIEQEFLSLLDQWANPLYFRQMWTQVQLVSAQILEFHQKMDADTPPALFRSQVIDTSITGRIFLTPDSERAHTLYESALQVVNSICETSPHARRVLERTFEWNVGHFLLFVHFVFACLHRQEDLDLFAVMEELGPRYPHDARAEVERVKARMQVTEYPFARGRIDPTGDAARSSLATARALQRMTELLQLCSSVYLRQMVEHDGERAIADNRRSRSPAEILLDNTRLRSKIDALNREHENLRLTTIPQGHHDAEVEQLTRTIEWLRHVHDEFERVIRGRIDEVRGHSFTLVQRALGANGVREQLLDVLTAGVAITPK